MLKSNASGTESAPALDILYIMKAVAAAYIISVILLLPAALIATWQCFSDKGISVMVNFITALGTVSCGFMSGRHSARGGLICGAVSGFIYAAVLCLIGNLAAQSVSFGMNAVCAAVIGTVCGAVGGIIGINTRRQRRR